MLLALGAALMLVKAEIVKGGFGVASLAVLLFLLLLIPVGKIQELSAQLAKFKTKIKVK